MSKLSLEFIHQLFKDLNSIASEVLQAYGYYHPQFPLSYKRHF